MTKTEIDTILQAAAAKQTWIKKGFIDFMGAWQSIEIPEGYEGPYRLDLFAEGTDRGDTLRFFIRVGSRMLDYDVYSDYNDVVDESQQYPELTLTRVRKAIKAIEDRLPRFFRVIQAGIDDDSEIGQKITRITAALKA